MSPERIEHFFTFEHYQWPPQKTEDELATSPIKMMEQLRFDISNYISHSKRAYRQGGSVYVASEFRYRSLYQVDIKSETLELALTGDVEIHPDSLGKSWPSRENGILDYLIFDYSRHTFAHLSLLPDWDAKYDVGVCVFLYGKHRFEFKDVKHPLTDSLFGSQDLSHLWRKECNTKCGTQVLELQSKFHKPIGFFQVDSHIVEPGMKLSQFMNLKFLATLPEDLEPVPIFTLTEVTVVLLELSCTRKED